PCPRLCSAGELEVGLVDGRTGERARPSRDATPRCRGAPLVPRLAGGGSWGRGAWCLASPPRRESEFEGGAAEELPARSGAEGEERSAQEMGGGGEREARRDRGGKKGPRSAASSPARAARSSPVWCSDHAG